MCPIRHLLLMVFIILRVVGFGTAEDSGIDNENYEFNPSDYPNHNPSDYPNHNPSQTYKPFLFTIEQKRNGWVVLPILGLLYISVGLVLVCKNYFVPSLEVVIEKYGVEPNVVGASFMAIGISFPGLLAGILTLFTSSYDKNFDSIFVPEVLFILIVIGICALLPKPSSHLLRWPIFRDLLFYSISIMIMLFSFFDQLISVWEATVLHILYASYLVILANNKYLLEYGKRMCSPKSTSGILPAGNTEIVTEMVGVNLTTCNNPEPDNIVSTEMSWKQRVGCIMMFPLTFVLSITLPNCQTPRGKRFWVWAYIGSVLWILCIYNVIWWWAISIAETFGTWGNIILIPFIVPIPGLISAIIVARKGLVEMAVSAATGCGLFETCVSHSLLWIGLLFTGTTYMVGVGGGSLCSAGILLGALALLVVIIMVFRWKMTKCLGGIMLVICLIFYGVTLAREFQFIMSC